MQARAYWHDRMHRSRLYHCGCSCYASCLYSDIMRSSGWCHIEDPPANSSPQSKADVSQYCSDQTMVRTRPHVLSEAEVAPSRRGCELLSIKPSTWQAWAISILSVHTVDQAFETRNHMRIRAPECKSAQWIDTLNKFRHRRSEGRPTS